MPGLSVHATLIFINIHKKGARKNKSNRMLV